MKGSSGTRLIKRYENRKLYDTASRRYVTIEALFEMVAQGQDLHVVDRATGDDLTTALLAQAFFEGVKQRTAEVPRHVLSRLIRLGARGDAAAAELPHPAEMAGRARAEAERIVGALVRSGRLSLEEALSLRQDITDTIHRFSSEAQRGVEARIRRLLDLHGRESGVQPAMEALKERLLSFEAYLDGGAEERVAGTAGGGRRPRGAGRPPGRRKGR